MHEKQNFGMKNEYLDRVKKQMSYYKIWHYRI